MPCNSDCTILQSLHYAIEVLQTYDNHEYLVVVDNNATVKISSSKFDKTFNLGTPSKELSLSSIHFFHNKKKCISLLVGNMINSSSFSIMTFHDNHSYMLEIIPIQDNFFLIKFRKHKVYNLLYRGLNNIFFTKKSRTEYAKQRLRTLNDYQLTICYLVAHGFSNNEIAEIINNIHHTEHQRSRNAIGVHVERLKNQMECCSRKALIEFLLQAGIQSILPRLIFDRLECILVK